MKTAATWLFIICLPLLLLMGSITIAANSQWLYERGFDKYSISAVTGIERPELEKVAAGLIHYWNSGDEYIEVTVIKDGQPQSVFNGRETIHLRDVKGLFRMGYTALAGTLAYALVFAGACIFWWRDRRRLGQGLLGGGALALGLMAALGLMVLFNFDGFFLQFHLLSFANDFWLLDPAKDYLVMMFPQGFWYDITTFIAVAAAAGAVVLGGLGWWLKTDRPSISGDAEPGKQ